MVFYGISATALEQIATCLGLTLENVGTKGRGISAKLTPKDSRDRYARKSGSGRRVKAASYEAFRDFILSAFANGATDVRTIHPKTRTSARMNAFEFTGLLEDFRWYNVGSQAFPAYMGDLSNEQVPETVIVIGEESHRVTQ